MVIHDETVDRTTDGKGLVNQFSLPELKRFRLKISHPNFNRSIKPDRPKCDINIELKSYETAYKVVDLIEKYVSEKMELQSICGF
jgi:glycerophosphoryl diester phosphodiesterase